jgi:hypothetical protein
MKRREIFKALGALCLSPLAASFSSVKKVGQPLVYDGYAFQMVSTTPDDYVTWTSVGTFDLRKNMVRIQFARSKQQ